MYRLTLAAALLSVSAAVAAAQTVPPAAGPERSAAAGPVAPVSQTLASIRAARLSMAEAIEAAERASGQGIAVEVEFERQDGSTPAHYEVKVVHADGRLIEHDVDADTGAILKSDSRSLGRHFATLTPADLRAARISLREAIGLAEQRAGDGARVVEAEIGRAGSAVVYEMELRTAVGTRDIWIDANGQARG